MTLVRQLAQRLPRPGDAALIITPHNRRFLTGFPSSDGLVLVTIEDALFLTDSRYIEAADRVVTDMPCLCYQRVLEALGEQLAHRGVRRLFVEANGMTLAEAGRLKAALPGIELIEGTSLDEWLSELRLVKTPAQLSKIREAQAMTEFGFSHILSRIEAGRTEREIALDLEFAVRRQGAEAVAFDFIVVSGENSSLPHGVPSDRVLQKGDFVTMDFGARVDGWHSDMTRTVAVGAVSEEQRHVYDTVRAAQEASLAVLREGLSCVEGDRAARTVIEEAGYGDCFGHGTGHGVGMEIHEQPRLSPLAGEQLLRTGEVVTVEPGIYLPGKFGVRIEDMVVITPNGCENLTHAPKELLVL